MGMLENIRMATHPDVESLLPQTIRGRREFIVTKLAAGFAMVKYLEQNPSIYKQINETTTMLVDGLRAINEKAGKRWTINQAGSMFTLFFTSKDVTDFGTAKTSDTGLFAKYFQHMLHQGIYLAPSQFEAMFISTAISPEIVEMILNAHEDFVKKA